MALDLLLHASPGFRGNWTAYGSTRDDPLTTHGGAQWDPDLAGEASEGTAGHGRASRCLKLGAKVPFRRRLFVQGALLGDLRRLQIRGTYPGPSIGSRPSEAVVSAQLRRRDLGCRARIGDATDSPRRRRSIVVSAPEDEQGQSQQQGEERTHACEFIVSCPARRSSLLRSDRWPVGVWERVHRPLPTALRPSRRRAPRGRARVVRRSGHPTVVP